MTEPKCVGAPGTLQILACQIDIPRFTDTASRNRHLERLTGLIGAELERCAADLVVLPELSSTPYNNGLAGSLPDLAEPLDGASFEAFAGLAERYAVHVLYGFPRRAEDGYRICQALAGPQGTHLGHYDKIHLAEYGASSERAVFVAGRERFIFEINGVRIAPIICYDIREPELSRHLCLDHRIHLLAHVGAYYRDESFYSWHPFVITRAVENQIHVLSLNRAGGDFGHSLYCAPWVDERTPEERFGEGEELRRLEVSVAAVAEARQKYPFLADRVEFYR